MKIVNILKIIEPYYIILSYGFIGFFIVITGEATVPIIVNNRIEGSYIPFFYALSIFFGSIYFLYYKVVKVFNKENNKNE